MKWILGCAGLVLLGCILSSAFYTLATHFATRDQDDELRATLLSHDELGTGWLETLMTKSDFKEVFVTPCVDAPILTDDQLKGFAATKFINSPLEGPFISHLIASSTREQATEAMSVVAAHASGGCTQAVRNGTVFSAQGIPSGGIGDEAIAVHLTYLDPVYGALDQVVVTSRVGNVIVQIRLTATGTGQADAGAALKFARTAVEGASGTHTAYPEINGSNAGFFNNLGNNLARIVGVIAIVAVIFTGVGLIFFRRDNPEPEIATVTVSPPSRQRPDVPEQVQPVRTVQPQQSLDARLSIPDSMLEDEPVDIQAKLDRLNQIASESESPQSPTPDDAPAPPTSERTAFRRIRPEDIAGDQS